MHADKIKEKLKESANSTAKNHFKEFFNNLFSLSRLKSWSGFIIGGIVVAALKGVMGNSASHAIAFFGLAHIAGIFILDFVHKNTIKKVHICVIFFWISYILADYGIMTLTVVFLPGGYITNMALSLMIAAFISDIIGKIRGEG